MTWRTLILGMTLSKTGRVQGSMQQGASMQQAKGRIGLEGRVQ